LQNLSGAVISRSDELLLLHALVFLSILLSDDWMMQLKDRAKKGGRTNLAELDAKFIAHGWLFWLRLLAKTLKTLAGKFKLVFSHKL
jgi:hypothetical protein